MITHTDTNSFIKKINNISEVWNRLKSCDNRGIHIYDDKGRSFHYLSYKEIYTESGYYAQYLKQHGVSRGCKVLLNAGTSKEFPPLWLAIIRLGAIPACFPPYEVLAGRNTYEFRLEKALKDFDYYICNENEIVTAERVKEKHLQKNNNQHLINNDRGSTNVEQGSTSTRILLKQDIVTDITKKKYSNPEPVSAHVNDVIYIQFSSGSTGTPKGICISYKNIFSNIYDMWTRLKFNPYEDCGATWLPLYHDMGLVGYFLYFLFNQINLVMISPQTFIKNPHFFLTLLSEYKIQMCSFPASALLLMLRRFNPQKNNKLSFESLKWIGIGAEPINIHLLKEFEKTLMQYGLKPGVISPCYGLAEATLAVSMYEPYQQYRIVTVNGQQYPTVGQLIGSLKIKIDSPDENGIGKIRIKGDTVAHYALIKGKMENILDREGYYDTNDIGFFDGDEFVILGRADDMFIYNGENFFPQEIEKIIQNANLKSVKRAVCFTIQQKENNLANPEIIILYESRKLSREKKQEIESMIKHKVAQYTGFQISGIHLVPPMSIPITTSGKIQRKKIKNLYLKGGFKE